MRDEMRGLDAYLTREPPEPYCPKCHRQTIEFDEELNQWECKCGYKEKIEGAKD